MPSHQENPTQDPRAPNQNLSCSLQKNTETQKLDQDYSNTINFLAQSNFLKLRNLTNLQQLPSYSFDREIELLLRRIQQLQAKVEQLQKKIKYKKKKRIRRTSEQILKKHNCEICKKKYGSLVSLNLHLRLKHAIPSSQERKYKGQVLEGDGLKVNY